MDMRGLIDYLLDTNTNTQTYVQIVTPNGELLDIDWLENDHLRDTIKIHTVSRDKSGGDTEDGNEMREL